MFKMYLSKEHFMRSMKQSETHLSKMLRLQDHIFLYDFDESEKYDLNSAIATIAMQNPNIKIDNANFFINQIKKDGRTILYDTNAVYFLDLPQNELEVIQKDYGVICQDNNVDDVKILRKGYGKSFPHRNGNSWSLFPLGRDIPSNCLIIQDRYFFSKESGENIYDSFNNLENILSNFLPSSLGKETHYQITIIFDDDSLLYKDSKGKDPKYEVIKGDDGTMNDVTFDYITKRINKLRQKLSKKFGYHIDIEIWGINKGCYGYKYNFNKTNSPTTHNRRIISNYFMLKAEHKLKAFRNEKSLASQEIRCTLHYTDGLDFDKDIDPSVWMHEDWIAQFKDVLNYAEENTTVRESYKYALNGKIYPCMPNEKIINRLLNPQKMNKKYFFNPYIGRNYYKKGINNIRILILGASHYCRFSPSEESILQNCCECRNCSVHMGNTAKFNRTCPNIDAAKENELLENYTKKVVEEFVRENEHYSFKVFNEFIDKNFNLWTDDFWSKIAFANYIQDFEEGSMGNHYKKEYLEAFENYLDELMPDIVIVWGVDTRNKGFKDTKFAPINDEMDNYLWTVPYNNKDIIFVNCYHPCRGITHLEDENKFSIALKEAYHRCEEKRNQGSQS